LDTNKDERRFGFAALCMLPWLLAPIDDQLKSITKEKFERCKSDMAKWEEPTRWAAGLAGMEIGVYNSIGYISQAIGLKTIPANKVSMQFRLGASVVWLDTAKLTTSCHNRVLLFVQWQWSLCQF
jgi:hypothetical protein